MKLKRSSFIIHNLFMKTVRMDFPGLSLDRGALRHDPAPEADGNNGNQN